ncbi:MAG: HPF/RaiA family ribosome-associated protein [Proteobacteria bacterium]|nr:HPF/RaiA family ribosome-associated protein [Pseudomonadota bacterium]
MDIRWHVVTDLAPSCREAAETRIEKLAEGQKDLIHVVVHVEGSKHHQHGSAEAKIRCQAKGRELIAHERDEEPEIALTRAVDVFEREVRTMRAKRRDHRDHRGGRGRQSEGDADDRGGDEESVASGTD